MVNVDLDSLRAQWLRTISFEDEQTYLAARVRLNDARFVGLDADGTLEPWLAIAIQYPTNVVYGTQCAGVRTEERFIEGYLLPLGGSKFGAEDERIRLDALTEVFHEGDVCISRWVGNALPEERMERLRVLVEQIPYWQCALSPGQDNKDHLRLDCNRAAQIAEAWIPVETPDGLGVLLYKNCD